MKQMIGMRRSTRFMAVVTFATAIVMSATIHQTIVTAETTAADSAQKVSQVLIKNVYIFDGVNNKLSKKTNVLVENNLIKKISPEAKAGAKATVIDGKGQTLIPGMINTHVHMTYTLPPAKLKDTELMYIGFMAAQESKNMLMRGFTTVRDVGGATIGLAKAIDDGLVVGPRIYPSGAAITQTSGHGDYRSLNVFPRSMGGHSDEMENMRFVAIVDGRAQMLAAVREQFRQGATQIKVLNSGSVSGVHDPLDVAEFTLEEMKAAVQAASDFGSYVMVHSYNDLSVKRGIKAGVKSIEHGNLMTEDTMKELKKNGVILSAQVIPFKETMGGFTEDMIKKNAEALAGLDNMFKLAKKYDVTITHGTDIFGSPELLAKVPMEFKYRLKWFTPFEILKQATSNGAELVAMCGERNPYKAGPLGVIKEGAYADLVIVNGNPLKDGMLLVDPAMNLSLIMKDGTIYKNTLK